MPIEKIFTFVCFSIWVLSAMLVFLIALLKPDIASLNSGRRLSASNFFDVAMLISVGAWLAMWCFRTMY